MFSAIQSILKLFLQSMSVIGSKFGKLSVVRIGGRDHFNRPVVSCECECGKQIKHTLASLVNGDATSCYDCENPKLRIRPPAIRKRTKAKKPRDIKGEKFNSLLACERIDSNTKQVFWKCKCDCGNEKIINYYDLINSRIKSCGCSRFRAKNAKGESNYIGVNRNCNGKWDSRIQVKRKIVNFGRFETVEQALAQRNKYICDNNLQDNYLIQEVVSSNPV